MFSAYFGFGDGPGFVCVAVFLSVLPTSMQYCRLCVIALTGSVCRQRDLGEEMFLVEKGTVSLERMRSLSAGQNTFAPSDRPFEQGTGMCTGVRDDS